MKYDILTIIKLVAATLLPVLLSVVLYFAERKTKFGKTNYWVRQAVIGVLFGGVAMLATAFGIPIEGAVLNVRNAAPLTAGLLFGGPAGIIAGVIGGVYRWFATYFGAGAFSQLACTIGCILAGLFGAGCRKFMFDNKKASWFYGFVIGGTTEVLHMLLVFITNMNDVYGAYKVVAICAVPMILCNAVSVMLSLLLVALIGKERIRKPMKSRQISQIFQFLLLICVVVAFTATTAFTTSLQTRIAYANADSLLELNLNDVEKDLQKTETADNIRNAVINRHIGKEGGIIVCNEQGEIIYDNGGHTGELIYTFKDANEIKATPGVRFTANIGNTKSYCMFSMAEELYIIAYIPISEAMFPRNIAVTILAFMEAIVFAALFAHIYFLIKKLIVDNIHKINGSLSQITDGNLNVHVNVRENEEFASLSDDINATVDTLKQYIAEAESRIDRELEFARQIQHSALPTAFPPYPERKDFDIFASMDAAKEVGGDFYDFCLTDTGHLMFLVADVSGKGIPGALFMMRAKTTIKNLVESGKEIDEVFTEANKRLCENNEAEMFVTAWMGLLDTETGVLQYVNAGHNPPLIRHGDGRFEYLRTRPNFILAGMEMTKYQKHELQFKKGDEIFVYMPSMNWMITGKCNYNCLHCFNAKDNAPLQSEWSLEEANALLDEAQKCGINGFTITGGEPMVHKSFFEIVEGIYARGMYVFELNTNGFYIDQSALDKMKRIGCYPLIKISFDGFGYHDWMRNHKGAEEDAISAIKLCTENGFCVKVQMNINRKNKDSIAKSLDYLDKIGVERTRIICTTESTRWAENAAGQSFTVPEYYDTCLEVLGQYIQGKHRMSVDCWQFLDLDPQNKTYTLTPMRGCLDRYRESRPLCQGNRGMIAVAANGEVYPCMQMSGWMEAHKISFGNVKKQGLQSILQSGVYLDEVCATIGDMIKVNRKCADCPHLTYCRGGCRAIAVLTSDGDMRAPDPWKCFFFEHGYMEKCEKTLTPYINRTAVIENKEIIK